MSNQCSSRVRTSTSFTEDPCVTNHSVTVGVEAVKAVDVKRIDINIIKCELDKEIPGKSIIKWRADVLRNRIVEFVQWLTRRFPQANWCDKLYTIQKQTNNPHDGRMGKEPFACKSNKRSKCDNNFKNGRKRSRKTQTPK